VQFRRGGERGGRGGRLARRSGGRGGQGGRQREEAIEVGRWQGGSRTPTQGRGLGEAVARSARATSEGGGVALGSPTEAGRRLGKAASELDGAERGSAQRRAGGAARSGEAFLGCA
jgi:hypothetical protein